MAGRHGYTAGTQFTCMDSHPDTLYGGKVNKDRYLFYLLEARCGSLKCPQYVERRELVRVFCSTDAQIFFITKLLLWEQSLTILMS